MNRVVLVGRLTKDPELRSTNNGMEVASFTVAINRTFKNKEGNYDADFINVTIWGRHAANVHKYCSKGSQVGVEGRIQTRSYDAQDGTKRYVTEVVADNVEFLGSKNSLSNTNNFVDTQSTFVPDVQPVQEIDVSNDDPFKDFGDEVALSDDDLPF